MATPTNDLQTALAGAGIEPEAAEQLGVALQQFMDEAVARQSSRDETPVPPMSYQDSERFVRIEQSLFDLRELMQVRFEAVDQRFDQVDRRFEDVDRRFDVLERRFEVVERQLEEVNRRLDVVERRIDLVERRLEEVERRFGEVERRFGEVERRFGEVDERLNRERLERLGFVTAATGAIVAGLLRLFGAI